MIYLEAANSFNQENEKEDRQRWMWRAYNNSNNSTAIQNMKRIVWKQKTYLILIQTCFRHAK